MKILVLKYPGNAPLYLFEVSSAGLNCSFAFFKVPKCSAVFYLESKISSFCFDELKVVEARAVVQLWKGVYIGTASVCNSSALRFC